MPDDHVRMFLRECHRALEIEDRRLAKALSGNPLYRDPKLYPRGILFLRHERSCVDTIIRHLPTTAFPYRVEWERKIEKGRTDLILEDGIHQGVFEFEPWFSSKGKTEISELANNVADLLKLRAAGSRILAILTAPPLDKEHCPAALLEELARDVREEAGVDSKELVFDPDLVREFPSRWESEPPDNPDVRFVVAFLEVKPSTSA